MATLRSLWRRFYGWLNQDGSGRPDTYRVGDSEERVPWRPGDDLSNRDDGFSGPPL